MKSKILQIAGDASFRTFYRIILNKKSKIVISANIRWIVLIAGFNSDKTTNPPNKPTIITRRISNKEDLTKFLL